MNVDVSGRISALGPTARTVIRDTLLVAPGYVIPGLASLIGVPVLFRTLGAAEYGLWALINSIASGVPPLTTSSVEALTLRFGHRDGAGGKRAEWALSAAGSAALGAFLAAVFVPGAPLAVVLASMGLAVTVSIYLLWLAGLQSQLRFGSASAVASVRALLGLTLAVIGAVATGSAIIAAWGLAAGFAIAVLVSPLLTRRTANGRRAITPPSRGGASGRLSYGLGSLIVAVGLFELSVGDRFILSALSKLEDLGVYAAVYTIEDLVLRLAPAVLLVALRPRLFRAWDSASRQRVTRGTAGVTAVILWLGLALTSGIIAIGEMTGAEASVTRLLGPIAIGLSASVAATSISFLYSAAERQWRLAAHVFAAAAVNVALNVLWVPSYGAYGAAVATAVSFAGLLGLHAVGLGRDLAEERAFIVLGLCSVSATVVVGSGSSLTGGFVWPAFGFIVTVCLGPLGLSSSRSVLAHVR